MPSLTNAPSAAIAFVQGIREEFAWLVGLLFCICLLGLSHEASDTGRLGWMAILSIQALPYLAAVACRLVEIRSQPRRLRPPLAKPAMRQAPESAHD